MTPAGFAEAGARGACGAAAAGDAVGALVVVAVVDTRPVTMGLHAWKALRTWRL